MPPVLCFDHPVSRTRGRGGGAERHLPAEPCTRRSPLTRLSPLPLSAPDSYLCVLHGAPQTGEKWGLPEEISSDQCTCWQSPCPPRTPSTLDLPWRVPRPPALAQHGYWEVLRPRTGSSAALPVLDGVSVHVCLYLSFLLRLVRLLWRSSALQKYLDCFLFFTCVFELALKRSRRTLLEFWVELNWISASVSGELTSLWRCLPVWKHHLSLCCADLP